MKARIESRLKQLGVAAQVVAVISILNLFLLMYLTTRLEDDVNVSRTLVQSSSSSSSSQVQFENRILVGIMTTLDSPIEKRRRQVIRETYLAYYKQQHAQNNNTPHRICSLQDLQASILVDESECQFVYTFVVGANPTGPTTLLEWNNTTTSSLIPMTVDTALISNQEEKDIVYLNIRENMNSGKSPSWLKYASAIAKELDLDYVAKADTDTLIIIPDFLDFVNQHLPPQAERVYGGIPLDKTLCGGFDYCQDMVADVYMSGELYFLSRDLAEYITSPSFVKNHFAVAGPDEDFTIGNFVASHPLPIQLIKLRKDDNYWQHGKHLKDPESLKKRWKEHFEQVEAKKKFQSMVVKIQQQQQQQQVVVKQF
jgi:hypothetical protein